MIYYIILNLILILLLALFHPHKQLDISNKSIRINHAHIYVTNEIVCTFISALLLSIFMGRRGNITADYNSYAMLFEKNAAQTIGEIISEKDYTELGFRLLNKLIGCISTDVDFYMFIIASIFVFLIVYEGRREVTNIMLFVLLFTNCGIYYLTFNLMRQGLAAAITYSATKYLRRKEKVKYILVVILATTIHTSALVMIPCCYLLNRSITKKNVMQLIIAGVGVSLFLTNIINFVQKFRYGGYTYGMHSASNLNGVIVQWCIFAFSIFILVNYKLSVTTDNQRIIVNGSLLFIIISILGLNNIQISRLSYFFSPYLMALCANMIDFASNKEKGWKIIRWMIIVLLVAYMYIWLNDTSYADYKFLT